MTPRAKAVLHRDGESTREGLGRSLGRLRARYIGGVGLVLAFACASPQHLDAHVDDIEQRLIAAEDAGAMRCAPRQLAIARSHLAFAHIEREQGFASRAERHLVIADENARAAQLLSPATFCRRRAPSESD